MPHERDLIDARLCEPSSDQEPTEAVAIGERQDGWGVGAMRHLPALLEHASRHHHPRVLLSRCEDGAGETSAATRHPARLTQRRRRVRHQHVPPAAKHAVDRRVRELQPLRVKDAALDVLQPCRGQQYGGDHQHDLLQLAQEAIAGADVLGMAGGTAPAPL